MTLQVQGLALEKNVPLIDVSDNKQLGEWAGLCKIDKDKLGQYQPKGTLAQALCSGGP